MEDDPGKVLDTVAWFLVSICALGVLGRSGVKAGVIQKIGADDVFIWLAMFFFIGQVITLHLAVKIGGLGQHLKDLKDDQKEFILKMDYINYLMCMPIYGFAKLSVVSLLRKFALGRRDRMLLYAFEWLLAGWAATSEFVYLFQCALPKPWDFVKGSCLNRPVWGAYFEFINMITDLMLVIMPTLVIMSLKAPLKKRIISSSFFAARIIILPVSIIRICYWLRYAFTDDITFTLFPYLVATMVVVSLEILSACALYLQPLFETLESGFMWSGDLKRRGQAFRPQWDKGSLPFTRMRTPDGLSGQVTEYWVTAEGPRMFESRDEEKSPKPWELHANEILRRETVDVHISLPPRERNFLPMTKLEQEALASLDGMKAFTEASSPSSPERKGSKSQSPKPKRKSKSRSVSSDRSSWGLTRYISQASSNSSNWGLTRYMSRSPSSKHASAASSSPNRKHASDISQSPSRKHVSDIPSIPSLPPVPPMPSSSDSDSSDIYFTPNLDVPVPDSPFCATPIIDHPNITAVMNVYRNKALPPPPPIPEEDDTRPTLEEKREPSQGW